MFDKCAPYQKNIVASYVPPVFESYARIFHPCMQYSFNGAFSFTWHEVAMRTGRNVHAWMSWDDISIPTTFTNTLTPPDIGRMPWEVSQPLRHLLPSWSHECYFGVWEGWGANYAEYVPSANSIDTGWQRVYDVFIGPTTMIDFSFFGNDDRQTANVFSALNNKWWMITDIDFMTTYIGGDKNIIDSIINSNEVEAWPISADDGLKEFSSL